MVIPELDAIRLGERGRRLSSFEEAELHTEAELAAADSPKYIRQPAVFVDKSDHIVLWYLPHAISKPNQVQGITILIDFDC